jgi:hypothetical protein
MTSVVCFEPTLVNRECVVLTQNDTAFHNALGLSSLLLTRVGFTFDKKSLQYANTPLQFWTVTRHVHLFAEPSAFAESEAQRWM